MVQSYIVDKLKDVLPSADHCRFSVVGGGSINQTYRLETGNRTFFCKINSATKFPQLFAREKKGLELLAKQNLVATPKVLACFDEEDQQVLVMDWIRTGEMTTAFWDDFGKQLAALHSVTNKTFGLHDDNYMGSVVQVNIPTNTWTDFFINQRLQPMIDASLEQDLLSGSHLDGFEKLYHRLNQVFDDHEKPALVHGDLWNGNFMCDDRSRPVLIDPAVYFGHRCMDLAMTNLFGGFPKRFYESYDHHFPLPKNYGEQWRVCNLYPLLIHLLLFGSSYLPRIDSILKGFD